MAWPFERVNANERDPVGLYVRTVESVATAHAQELYQEYVYAKEHRCRSPGTVRMGRIPFYQSASTSGYRRILEGLLGRLSTGWPLSFVSFVGPPDPLLGGEGRQ